jgi:hypothetical protein
LKHLEDLAQNAGYEDLLRRMFKELMMMGFISFTVFLAFNGGGIRHDNKYYAFEFSHITTFFVAFFFVLRACLIVLYSKYAKKIFWRAHNCPGHQLLARYENVLKNRLTWESIVFNYFGMFSPLRTDINSVILESFFGKTYPLTDDFHFPEYLSKK